MFVLVNFIHLCCQAASQVWHKSEVLEEQIDKMFDLKMMQSTKVKVKIIDIL